MKRIHVIVFLAFLTAITANEEEIERKAKIPTKCPYPEKDNKTTTHLAHETDCTKFYQCAYGKGVSKDCALMDKYRRLHFNRRLQVCDWPSQAGCSECPGKDNNGNYPRSKISHKKDDCNLFWECIDGKKYLRRCPRGLCFSRTCQGCVKNRKGGNCDRRGCDPQE